jgi:hypothetical protein
MKIKEEMVVNSSIKASVNRKIKGTVLKDTSFNISVRKDRPEAFQPISATRSDKKPPKHKQTKALAPSHNKHI